MARPPMYMTPQGQRFPLDRPRLVAAQRRSQRGLFRTHYLVTQRQGNRVDRLSRRKGRAAAELSLLQRRPGERQRADHRRHHPNPLRRLPALVRLPLLRPPLPDTVRRCAVPLSPLLGRKVTSSCNTRPNHSASAASAGACGNAWKSAAARSGRCGLDHGFPPKPPRMHWKTYRRLEARDEDLAGRWRIGVGDWLERTDPQRIAARRAR